MTTKLVHQAHAHIRAFARHHNLPPQAECDLAAILDGHREALAAHRRAMIADWADQVRSDPEIGRNFFPSAIASAREAVKRFGGDALRKALDDTGLGSHPEIVRAFARIGKATRDQPSPGPKRRPTHEETMRAMYPSMYGNKI